MAANHDIAQLNQLTGMQASLLKQGQKIAGFGQRRRHGINRDQIAAPDGRLGQLLANECI